MFLENMGPCTEDKFTIERIDNNRGYEPGNCRWASMAEQAKNKRNTHFLTFAGITLCVSEWARIAGLSSAVIYERLKRGWESDRVLDEACKKGKFHAVR